MAATMLNNSRNLVKQISSAECARFWQQVRTGFTIRHRGKPPHLARTWAQRLKEIEDHLQGSQKTNIGMASPAVEKMTRKLRRKLIEETRTPEMEKLARKMELAIPIEEITSGPMNHQRQRQLHSVASHYGIFCDLFGGDYFYPQVSLQVLYEIANVGEAISEEDSEDVALNPVFYGNVLDPSEAQTEPFVEFDGEEGKYYTLCMTAPDSHLQDNNKEYLHWMVGNIPGSSVQDGTVLCNYLRPFPLKGTGFHRYVFVLYQHDNTIDFSVEQKSCPCTSLVERTFSSADFYQKHQESLKPVGLAFFQSEWDETVRKTFHHILDMGEPRFEFIVPQKFIPKQEEWPIREPFNVYMDRYRDVKDISEEVLREKLKNAHPFKPRPAPRTYPNVYKPDLSKPSWLRQKINDQVLRKAQWKALDD